MLPKKFRLTKPEFKAVRDSGRFFPSRLMAILLLRKSQPLSAKISPNQIKDKSDKPESDLSDLSIIRSSRSSRNSDFSGPYPKAGLIVSLRLSPKAVVRNRLKRRLRAALRRVLPDINSNLHLVILPNRRALNATVDELENELRNLVQKTQNTRKAGISDNQKTRNSDPPI